MKNSSKLPKPIYDSVSVSDLIPYANNARTHSEVQVAQIAASIKEFGFINPVIIDADFGIIAGHGRVLAAQKLKMGLVPCIRVEHLTPAQKRAYILADNKLALNAGWDEQLLSVEIASLKEENFDALLTGFGQEDLDRMLSEFMPDLPPEDPDEKERKYLLTVSFENEEEQENLFQYLNSKGYKVKAK
jgi:ParB-like chromosome segregation protein Spo0J